MPSDMFVQGECGEHLGLTGADLIYFKQITLPYSQEYLLTSLVAQIPWREEDIFIYGKKYRQPRLLAWYGDVGAVYRYSGVTHAPLAWSQLLIEIKQAVENLTGRQFNSALLNYYRNQRDSMGMHSDDEPELGRQPIIASLSLGAERTLIFLISDLPQKALQTMLFMHTVVQIGCLLGRYHHGNQQSSIPKRLMPE